MKTHLFTPVTLPMLRDLEPFFLSTNIKIVDGHQPFVGQLKKATFKETASSTTTLHYVVSDCVHKFIVHTCLLLTIFECVDLLCQNFPNAFFSLINIVVTNRLHYVLLHVQEVSCSLRCNRLGHLLIVMAQLTDILQVSDMLINLLLILAFKLDSKQAQR